MTLTTFMNYVLDIQSAVVVVLLGYGLVTGYHRRKPHWSHRSWLAFASACGVALLLILPAILLGEAFANGVYSSNRDARSMLTLIALASLVLGSTLLTLLVYWFARGTPEGSFPGAFGRSLSDKLFLRYPHSQ